MSDLAVSRWHWRCAAWLKLAFRWHRAAFLCINAVAIAMNVWLGGAGWSIWLVATTAVALLMHFMVMRTLHVDEAWAKRRTRRVCERSYERANIEAVMKTYGARKDLRKGRK